MDSEALITLIVLLVVVAPIVLLLVTVARVGSLMRRVNDLEREVKKLRITAPQPTTATPTETSVRTTPETAQQPQPPRPVELHLQPPASLFPPERSPAPEPKRSTLPPSPPPRPARSRQEWEELVGGKLLNRIGALALVIGIGFFLKYAFDREWISEAMRVSIGGITGIALLLLGHRFVKRNLHVFAQGPIGAGISVLYLSVYATFNFYHLVSQPIAFAMMSAVTALTFFLAFRYDSLAVSLLGWAGGFLTPFLLSTGEANAVGLFSYILLLDVGLLSALVIKAPWKVADAPGSHQDQRDAREAKRESWIILEPLTLGATWFIYLAWYDRYYEPADLSVAILFAVLFWFLFHALDVLHLLRSEPHSPWLRRSDAVLNGFVFYGVMHSLVFDNYPDRMGAVALGIGAAYFGTYLLLMKKGSFQKEDRARYVLSAVALLAVATGIQFRDHEYIAISLLSVEALALAWYGARQEINYLWKGALVLFVVATFWLIVADGTFGYEPIADFVPLLNLRAMAFIGVAASLAAAGIALEEINEAAWLGRILQYTWPVFGFALIGIEVVDFFDKRGIGLEGTGITLNYYHQAVTLAVGWMLYSLALTGIGRLRRATPVLTAGVIVGLIAALVGMLQGIAFVPIVAFTPVLNYRVLTLLVVAIGLALHAQSTTDLAIEERLNNYIGTILRIGVLLALFVLLTGETRDYFTLQKSHYSYSQGAAALDELNRLENMKQLLLSGAWLLYSVVLMTLGIWRRMQSLRIAAIVLYGITILKIFLYDLSGLDTLYRIFSFIGLGLILLGSSYLYQRFKGIILGEEMTEVTPAVKEAA